MTINTDYAQYQAYGLARFLEKLEDEVTKDLPNNGDMLVPNYWPTKEPEPKKDDSIKSNVISPKWLKKGRSRAKLWSIC